MNDKDKERLRVVIEQVFIGWDIGSRFPDERWAKGQILDLIDRQLECKDLLKMQKRVDRIEAQFNAVMPKHYAFDIEKELCPIRKALGVEEVER